MGTSDVECTRAGAVLRSSAPLLLLGGALCLVILFLGQWPQTCNGVQVCPPLSTRPSTAAGWTVVVAPVTIVAIGVRLALPTWADRLSMGALTVVGCAGAVTTLLVTGF